MSGRVIVVGAGVVGVTTAYFLARRGCEVTVVDRRGDVALETSFANAGEISPGYASPWASPDVPRKIPKWLLMEHAPLILKPTLDPAMLRWLLAMLRNCTRERYALNKGRMVRLAEYSRDCLITLRAETGVEYDGRTLGTLQLFRTRAQVDASAKDIEVLGRDGVPFKILDRAGCVAREPGLAAASDEFEGGLLLPNDETGDCYKFTVGLAALARDLGVAFRFGTNVRGISHDGRRATGVETDAGAMMSDAVVLAAGSFSPHLARPLGLRLPVYPVKGYSATVPISQEELSPRSTLLDESYKIAITRLGDRIRIGGMAEISGYSLGIADARRDTLMRSARSLFPEAGIWRQAEFWSGLRPMTPDGTPVIGATNVPNLYLNTGHGTLGWTMACGSATVLADIVVGQSPAIDITGLGLDRYNSPRAGPFETTKSTQAVTA